MYEVEVYYRKDFLINSSLTDPNPPHLHIWQIFPGNQTNDLGVISEHFILIR